MVLNLAVYRDLFVPVLAIVLHVYIENVLKENDL